MSFFCLRVHLKMMPTFSHGKHERKFFVKAAVPGLFIYFNLCKLWIAKSNHILKLMQGNCMLLK